MRLDTYEIEVATGAVASYLHEDFSSLPPAEQSRLRFQLQHWLLPCLITLPEGITSNQVGEGCFFGCFWDAAQQFLLMRERETNSSPAYGDEDVRRRLEWESIEESANNLLALTVVALEAVETYRVMPHPRPFFQDESLEEAWEEWDAQEHPLTIEAFLGPAESDS